MVSTLRFRDKALVQAEIFSIIFAFLFVVFFPIFGKGRKPPGGLPGQKFFKFEQFNIKYFVVEVGFQIKGGFVWDVGADERLEEGFRFVAAMARGL